MFKFCERLIALTAHIEFMFLKMQVSEKDIIFLSFIWRQRTNVLLQLCDYQDHVLAAKCSLTGINYALKQVRLDIEKLYPKAIQNNI